ncbi:hypothetical protein NDU88_005387 [Pleurodeles waltl]|uniref:Uncharacterized protein n=1 Tax=Pleurodeles waltl TaxID=8319 RepID=A0AAV7WWW6_PLEWA|nr:hypothetical protein NDU88_005387 [Pleurodeles waltl]
MTTQKQGKKGSSLRVLFAKTPVKKQDFARKVGPIPQGDNSGRANELHIIRTLEEAEALLDMDFGQNDLPAGGSEESSWVIQGKQGHTAQQRKKKPTKPSEKESKKEREDLLRMLRHQECLPETGQGL